MFELLWYHRQYWRLQCLSLNLRLSSKAFTMTLYSSNFIIFSSSPTLVMYPSLSALTLHLCRCETNWFALRYRADIETFVDSVFRVCWNYRQKCSLTSRECDYSCSDIITPMQKRVMEVIIGTVLLVYFINFSKVAFSPCSSRSLDRTFLSSGHTFLLHDWKYVTFVHVVFGSNFL